MDTILKKVELPNGETMGYRYKQGGEKTLLLVHGNMTSSKHWDVFMEAFDSDYTIYAPDLRGFGISTYNNPIDSLDDFKEDLKLFVDELGLSKFDLMGWSTGGGVCMIFAADYPSYVDKLILMESVGTRGYPILKKDGEGKPIKDEFLKTKEEIAQDPVQVIPILSAYNNKDKDFLKVVWEATIYTHNKPEPQKYEEYLDDMLTQRNLVDVDYALATFNISEDYNGIKRGDGRAKNIKSPTLILWGENDLVVPEQMALDIQNDIGENAQLIYLKNCGHSPLVDDLDQLIKVMKKFLIM
ncbi:alpha/beta fold hydrolase [Petrotoga sibirica]|uniref:Pimeloyl-ACP methyl ester carboxylesterase n=2 Tax=Petrotoga sibirica TaxID=156202 RepID=A0A4R8EFA8_9BACT|nr:alpha/beta hydrolase [Petrotoga sibirica]KUK83690.1 MAG: Alpha/beta hydrolase fold [Petrotoga mobilis]POZ89001.1 3-oxoadipate enol-lactonase [Petrotoga sibirica DSM 13575]TDX10106.1 pimeloyl-ACP methyl ester carboxylesterase [Petrotoga sibirica]